MPQYDYYDSDTLRRNPMPTDTEERDEARAERDAANEDFSALVQASELDSK